MNCVIKRFFDYVGMVILANLLFISLSLSLSAEIVGSKVYEKLNSQNLARVIIVLDSGDTKFTDLSAKMDVLDSKKSKVMSKLSSSEFILSKSWDTLNAFSGFISLEGLAKLSEDPGVIKVDLDVGGKGGLDQSRPLINGDEVHDAGFRGCMSDLRVRCPCHRHRLLRLLPSCRKTSCAGQG